MRGIIFFAMLDAMNSTYTKIEDDYFKSFSLVEMEPGGGMCEVKKIKAKNKSDAIFVFQSIFQKLGLDGAGFATCGRATYAVMESYKE